MATVKRSVKVVVPERVIPAVKEKSFDITLNEAEAQGLYTLLHKGVGSGTVERSHLRDLMSSLSRAGVEPASLRFKQVAQDQFQEIV